MFLLVALFPVVGDFIEPIPCIVIFMPIVAALAEAGGINAVNMGVVLIVTLAFGLITPPYGLALVMASNFVGVRFSLALKASLSIYVAFVVTLAARTSFPELAEPVMRAFVIVVERSHQVHGDGRCEIVPHAEGEQVGGVIALEIPGAAARVAAIGHARVAGRPHRAAVGEA